MKNNILIALVAASALAAGYWLASTQLTKELVSAETGLPAIQGAVISPPRKVGVPALIRDDNSPLIAGDFKGHWSLLFFGYTHCPDVCPTTMGVLAQAKKTAQASTPPLVFPQAYFVSVDPQRDKPALLADYVDYFDPAFVGVTGDAELIKALTLQLSAVYLIMAAEDDARPDDYVVDHSSALYLLNPDGNLAAMLSPPFSVEKLLKDIRAVMSLSR
ncbi:MAG TPA: SCO family protein [Thiotrichales bacterium]|nr:SCO family protein [Thiotrichales bacterium]